MQSRARADRRFTVREGDRDAPKIAGSVPLVLVLDNLRSAFNVGNILRLAEATRLASVVTCGYTASPPHPKLAATARGCDGLVPCRHTDSTADALRALRTEGYRLYGVETAAGARSVWHTSFSFPAALVLGNEALGVSADALELCDECVAVPCFGAKNSVNVGNCAAVVLYAALHQFCDSADDATARAMTASLRDDAGAPAGTPPGRATG